MSGEGGSVTLVFYKIGSGTEILKEPFLNLVAAAFQMSTFTHVELAIGTRNINKPHCTLCMRKPQSFMKRFGTCHRQRGRFYGANVQRL